eukprot:2949837-Rhodomonas_salina.2
MQAKIKFARRKSLLDSAGTDPEFVKRLGIDISFIEGWDEQLSDEASASQYAPSAHANPAPLHAHDLSLSFGVLACLFWLRRRGPVCSHADQHGSVLTGAMTGRRYSDISVEEPADTGEAKDGDSDGDDDDDAA